MRNSVEFLKEKLELLSKKFDGLKIRYEFVEKTKLHLIETTPYSFYDDISYLLEEEAIEESFEETFPNERFLFLGESPLYEINNITAYFESGLPNKTEQSYSNFEVSDMIVPTYNENFNYSSWIAKIVESKSENHNLDYYKFHVYTSLFSRMITTNNNLEKENCKNETNENDCLSDFNSYLKINNLKLDNSNVHENQYALAA